MHSDNIQVSFFHELKSQIPQHLSLVDEVADLLNISTDSAYRRIRGEKPIDLEEAQILCRHFKVSLDKLMQLKTDAFIFTGNINAITEHAFEEWMNNLIQQMQVINSFQKKHIYFLIKDIPPFLHFQIKELAAFKFFLWMKSILLYDSFHGVKFRIDDPRYDEYYPPSKKIIELYNKLPTTEIWNIESINSTLRQIDFYYQAGAFENNEDVKVLYGKVEELMNHIEKEAETGTKFTYGKQPSSTDTPFRMFVNELILGDNTFLVEVDNMRSTYLNHSVLFYVGTKDEDFNQGMFRNIENLIKKSALISSVGEKERYRFFNRLRQKIHNRMESVR
jgi:hypothetical protein